MKAEGINGTVYTHTDWRSWSRRWTANRLMGPTARGTGRGDVLIVPGTWFSIEHSATTPVSEWGGKELWVGAEEDAVIDEAGRHRGF
jgi:hypothetical protein